MNTIIRFKIDHFFAIICQKDFFKGLMFGRALIGIFQKMRIKTLRGLMRYDLKKNSTPSIAEK